MTYLAINTQRCSYSDNTAAFTNSEIVLFSTVTLTDRKPYLLIICRLVILGTRLKLRSDSICTKVKNAAGLTVSGLMFNKIMTMQLYYNLSLKGYRLFK